MRKSFQSVVAAACVALLSSSVWAAISFDQNVTPDIIFGSGNTNGLFTVDRSNGIELGLRAKIPFVGTTNSNGDGTYSYSIVEQESAPDSGTCPAVGGCWNFDWTVNTDQMGTSGVKIDGVTYLMEIDFDPSAGTNFEAFDPITPNVPPLNAPFFDHAIGDNTTPNGGGTEAVDGTTYATLIAGNNVAQNSWRHAFFANPPTFSYDPTIDGTYDVRLSAFDPAGSMLARTSIQVIIGAGGAPVTGACCNAANPSGSPLCTDGVDAANCAAPQQLFLGQTCAEVEALGLCVAVPAVSEWGLVVLTLIGLVSGSIVFSRRRSTTA